MLVAFPSMSEPASPNSASTVPGGVTPEAATHPASPEAALPPGATRALQPLDPAIRTIWSIKTGLFMGLLALGVLFYDLTHWLGGADRALPAGTLTGIAVLFGAAVAIGLPRLRYRFWRFDLRAEELYLERGVFNRVRTIVPLRRIQHLDVSQDLIEREFGLGKLIVHTAGARSSDVVVPGLAYEEAERLRDDVKRYVLDDDDAL